MTEALKIISYIVFGVLAAFLLVRYRSASDPRLNQQVALDWIANMDVIHEGKRYQSQTSTMVCEGDPRSAGGRGWIVSLICQTKSGRPYLLEVTASDAMVKSWAVYPIEQSKFESILKSLAQENASHPT